MGKEKLKTWIPSTVSILGFAGLTYWTGRFTLGVIHSGLLTASSSINLALIFLLGFTGILISTPRFRQWVHDRGYYVSPVIYAAAVLVLYSVSIILLFQAIAVTGQEYTQMQAQMS